MGNKLNKKEINKYSTKKVFTSFWMAQLICLLIVFLYPISFLVLRHAAINRYDNPEQQSLYVFASIDYVTGYSEEEINRIVDNKRMQNNAAHIFYYPLVRLERMLGCQHTAAVY